MANSIVECHCTFSFISAKALKIKSNEVKNPYKIRTWEKNLYKSVHRPEKSLTRTVFRKKKSGNTAHSRSETSLNTVVHVNVKVHMNQYVKFFFNSLKFFQKLPSAHIFFNCTNLSKFVKIVFNTCLNFTKLSNISKIFWQASIKF